MIIPVILAGGAGTRLWPASRKSHPKQFTSFTGVRTLFQDTARRLDGLCRSTPTVITGDAFRFMAAEQLDDIGIADATILLEPEGRNTAPAVLVAALLHAKTPDAVLLVSPSDHAIADEDAFAKAILAGHDAARTGALVTFGIQPTRPETGYGYLELSMPPEPCVPQPLRAFVEKPSQPVAEAMLAGCRHLWNAGIFMFRVDTILKAYDAAAPEMVSLCRAALATGGADLGFFRLGAEAWSRCADISIDHAVMERADALQVVPVSCGWSDLGSWRSVRDTSACDAQGNALSGAATQIGCKDTLIKTTNTAKPVVGIGLDNVAVIATDDAVLVTHLDSCEQVKHAVSHLRAQAVPQADAFQICHRPWGHYETLSLGTRFQVKRISVKPGGKLSLQSHFHRAEHWVVVEGSAHVTVDETVRLMGENQSIYIPLGAVHRLENRGKVPLTLIEVQSGAYLGEDDIVRYEDIYARVDDRALA